MQRLCTQRGRVRARAGFLKRGRHVAAPRGSCAACRSLSAAVYICIIVLCTTRDTHRWHTTTQTLLLPFISSYDRLDRHRHNLHTGGERRQRVGSRTDSSLLSSAQTAKQRACLPAGNVAERCGHSQRASQLAGAPNQRSAPSTVHPPTFFSASTMPLSGSSLDRNSAGTLSVRTAR